MKILNWNRSLLTALAAGGAISMCGTVSADNTTTLTGLDATNEAVPTDHGSTSEATLTWDDAWDQYGGWPNDPGDGVYQHDNGAGTPHTILFAPNAGFMMTISDFDSNVWVGGGDTGYAWEVHDGAGGSVLASGSGTTLNDSISNVTVGYTGAVGQALEFSIDQVSGVSSYYALDNITFSTTSVPEPGSLGFACIGLGAMVMRRKRG